MVLFDYFDDIDRSKLQILNTRLYNGIMPNWLNKVKINTRVKFRATERLGYPSIHEI